MCSRRIQDKFLVLSKLTDRSVTFNLKRRLCLKTSRLSCSNSSLLMRNSSSTVTQLNQTIKTCSKNPSHWSKAPSLSKGTRLKSLQSRRTNSRSVCKKLRTIQPNSRQSSKKRPNISSSKCFKWDRVCSKVSFRCKNSRVICLWRVMQWTSYKAICKRPKQRSKSMKVWRMKTFNLSLNLKAPCLKWCSSKLASLRKNQTIKSNSRQ